MNKTIVYSLVAVAGIMLAIIAFTIQDFNKTTEPNIVKKDGVKTVTQREFYNSL